MPFLNQDNRPHCKILLLISNLNWSFFGLKPLTLVLLEQALMKSLSLKVSYRLPLSLKASPKPYLLPAEQPQLCHPFLIAKVFNLSKHLRPSSRLTLPGPCIFYAEDPGAGCGRVESPPLVFWPHMLWCRLKYISLSGLQAHISGSCLVFNSSVAPSTLQEDLRSRGQSNIISLEHSYF